MSLALVSAVCFSDDDALLSLACPCLVNAAGDDQSSVFDD